MINNPEIAAQALLCLIETIELFPSMIKIDLYGGVYSIYESKVRILIALINGRGVSDFKFIYARRAEPTDSLSKILPKYAAVQFGR